MQAKEEGLASQIVTIACQYIPPGAEQGDFAGCILLAQLVEYAYRQTNGKPVNRSAAFQAALEILRDFPMQPLAVTDTPGTLNMMTRNLAEGVYVTMTVVDGDLCVLDFVSLTRGIGRGTEGMNVLCEIADRYGINIVGLVESHDNNGGSGPLMDAEQLVRYYAKFGFEVRGFFEGRPDVIRLPKPKA